MKLSPYPFAGYSSIPTSLDMNQLLITLFSKIMHMRDSWSHLSTHPMFPGTEIAVQNTSNKKLCQFYLTTTVLQTCQTQLTFRDSADKMLSVLHCYSCWFCDNLHFIHQMPKYQAKQREIDAFFAWLCGDDITTRPHLRNYLE